MEHYLILGSHTIIFITGMWFGWAIGYFIFLRYKENEKKTCNKHSYIIESYYDKQTLRFFGFIPVFHVKTQTHYLVCFKCREVKV